MNKDLEALINAKENFRVEMQIPMDFLIPVLIDFEKRLKTIENKLGIYTEEEIKKIKVGGTDPD